MKFNDPINKNYVATVVEIKNTYDLANCDNLVGANIFGFQVLINNETKRLGVFFPAEVQLSDEFCFENNLYRHGDRNKDKGTKGYVEDNRRVRAIKFRGNNSSGLFMPIESLSWTGINVSDLKIGDEFDFLNGKEICRKYTVFTKERKSATEADREWERTDKRYFPEHIDTENFFKVWENLDLNSDVVITQKLHGTSIRIGNTLVNRKPTIVERIAKLFGAKIQETEYANLYGSRKVIKDANNPNQNHYYDSDIWTINGKKLDDIIPENYVLYGELIGWASPEKEIQSDYTYGIEKGASELYIYRIAIVNSRGQTTDLSWEQVKEFCKNNGLKYTPELWKGKLLELVENDLSFINIFMDVRYFDDLWGGVRSAVWLGENKDIVDEGVCIRIDGINPKIYKAKCKKFFEHETKILDTGNEDLESSQS
jgi:hypothetical protein